MQQEEAAGLPLFDRTEDAAGADSSARPDPPPLLSTGSLLGEVLGVLQQRHKKRIAGEWVGGMRTGFTLLDTVLRGLSPGRISVLNATTNLGKSSFSNQLAYQVAAFEGQNACAVYVTFENDPIELVLKLLARLSGWPLDALEDGSIDPDHDFVKHAARRIAATPVYYVRGNSATSAAVLNERLQEARQQSGRADALLVYDYLQMGARFLPGQSATDRVGLAVANLTSLAKEAAVHVWAVGSQNRETNKSGEVTMHGGRDSGTIEYDANHLLVMSPGDGPHDRLLSVVKNRHGRAAENARLVYRGALGYFAQEGDDDDRWAF